MDKQTTLTEFKREQIINAAVAEFQERGFSDASMDRISKRAEVSKRTVYKHFESKENLFSAIVEMMWGRMAAELDISYSPDRDIRQQLTELAEAEGRLFVSKEVMGTARMLISENLRNPEVVQNSQIKIDAHSVFSAFLTSAADAGVLHIEDPDGAAQEFVGLLKARAFWPFVFSDNLISAKDLRHVIDSTVEMVMCRYGSKSK